MTPMAHRSNEESTVDIAQRIARLFRRNRITAREMWPELF